jgi:RHS repeat-associated protein
VWLEGAGTSDRRWLHADPLGSIVAVSNAGGSALAINADETFGRPAATNLGRFQYTGQAFLAETGLYHYKARAYHPALGRFLQPDPLGYDAGDMNLYAYVGNDPINARDPWGMETIDEDTIVVAPRLRPGESPFRSFGRRSTTLGFEQALLDRQYLEEDCARGGRNDLCPDRDLGCVTAFGVPCASGEADLRIWDVPVAVLGGWEVAGSKGVVAVLGVKAVTGSARTGSKIALPSLKSSPFGPKVATVTPRNGVPRNWSRSQIRDAISDYRTSIASRKGELAALMRKA